MMNIDIHITQRLWEWECRTSGHLPLRLSGLPITDLPVDRIPEGVLGLNVSHTHITDPYYPTRLPNHVRSLQHNGYKGISLQGLENTRLRNLVLEGCPNLETLGPLPPTLRKLTIYKCPRFVRLPTLPAGLEWLTVDDCPSFEVLPTLPASLTALYIYQSGVKRLPNLPDEIGAIFIPRECFEARLLDFRWGVNAIGWPSLLPSTATRAVLLSSFHRSQARMSCMKEELIMAAWHPHRVEQWLTKGEDVLDMMIGC